MLKLALIANEWHARGHGAPDYKWLESLGQRLTRIREPETDPASLEPAALEHGAVESDKADCLESVPNTGLCELVNSASAEEFGSVDFAGKSAADFKTVAEALYHSTNGAAILDASGEIQYSNAALLSLSAAGTFSVLGHSLLSVLQVSVDDFAGLLGRVCCAPA